jgi:hypothetical protein
LVNSRVWTYGLGGILLGLGAVALLMFRDQGSLGWQLVALVLGGTTGISFVVGYVMGYIAESGLGPGSREGQ